MRPVTETSPNLMTWTCMGNHRLRAISTTARLPSHRINLRTREPPPSKPKAPRCLPTYLPTCVLIYASACPPPYFLTPWREPPNSPPSASAALASASASAPATRLQSSPAPSFKRGGGKTDRGTAEHKPPRRRQLEPVYALRSVPPHPFRLIISIQVGGGNCIG
jgi:hypothetical protein